MHHTRVSPPFFAETKENDQERNPNKETRPRRKKTASRTELKQISLEERMMRESEDSAKPAKRKPAKRTRSRSRSIPAAAMRPINQDDVGASVPPASVPGLVEACAPAMPVAAMPGTCQAPSTPPKAASVQASVPLTPSTAAAVLIGQRLAEPFLEASMRTPTRLGSDEVLDRPSGVGCTVSGVAARRVSGSVGESSVSGGSFDSFELVGNSADERSTEASSLDDRIFGVEALACGSDDFELVESVP